MIRATVSVILFLLGMAYAWRAPADEPAPMPSPHRVELGFFDIHVCNWTDRPMFFMALFSTTRFSDIAAVEVFDPDGKSLGPLDLTRYRLPAVPGKVEKRVFISQIGIPKGSRDGWYTARITDRIGSVSVARDFVVIAPLPIVAGAQPAPGAENVPLPRELRWSAAPGAKHYQVFVQDLWEHEKLIYTSPILHEPRAVLPPGLLRAGGYYAWRVHARDVNEHELLGDFNHGSLGAIMKFSVAE